MALPLALIVAIVVADVLSPESIHLGPLLIVAPALSASFASPRLVATISALSAAALIAIALLRGVITTTNIVTQFIAIIVISAIVVVFTIVRERRRRELAEVRTVSDAAQQAVLRPLPRRVGPLRVASVYLAAQDQAQIGGDLYAAARTARGTRLIIGDVMGKGLTAVSDAAMLLGAFREAAHRQGTLPELLSYLESSVCWNLAEPTEPDQMGEFFITALLLDVPDDESKVSFIDCGHPPPLLLRDRQVVPLETTHYPPLGLENLAKRDPRVAECSFGVGDILLLYTDGVSEARDPTGAFYPLVDRVDGLDRAGPQTLVHYLRDDLLAYAGGRLGDDAAIVALERTTERVRPMHHSPLPLRRTAASYR